MNELFLPDVADLIMGQSPPSESYNSIGEGLPFFQGKADFGEINPTVRIFCNKPIRIVEPGDILMSVRAPVGPTNIVNHSSCIGRGLAAIRCKKNTDRMYLLYFLRFIEPKLVEIGRGSTFEAIGRDDLEGIKVPLPPLPEQQRIAAILAQADRLRRLRRYALQLGETFLQSVFLEMFGDPVRNPKGWIVGQIRDLCETILDCPHATPIHSTIETEYASVRSSDIQNGYFNWSTTKYVDHDEYQKRIARGLPTAGDVIYCREGARFGNAARIPQNLGKKICLGQRMMLFRVNHKKTTSEFLWAILESNNLYKQAESMVGGSASPHVNVQDIKKFKTIIPPLAEQARYTQLVISYDRLLSQQREAERQAGLLFQSLLQRAFAGGL